MKLRSALYEKYVESHLAPRYDLSIENLKNQESVFRKLLSPFLPSDKEAYILDAGCGHGALLHFLQSNGYQNTVGIDRSKSQAELARKLNIQGVEEGDLFHYLEGRPETFDLVIAFDTIEHLKKEEVFDFSKLVFQALKPGGKLVIRTPNGAGPLSGAYRYGDFTHELSFTRSSIQQLMLTAGFSQIRVFPVEPIVHGFVSAIRYALWQVIAAALRFYMLVETGETGEIFTQNLMAVALK